MKISYNWLKQFISTEKTPQELSLILTDIGLEVESLEVVQGIPGGLEGLVIGEVKSCLQHPNADRLRVTKVDVGQQDLLQIVCGAPNVATGQKVVVAPVGTTLYPLSGDAFKINKSKIRGEVSEGMICAEDEIGLGPSHDGIMVLNADAAAGLLAKDYFQIKDDYCFEIGLTPNRADAASHLGVARDLAAYFRTNYTLPTVGSLKIDHVKSPVAVTIKNPQACKRYTSLTISGIEVKPSPEWLAEKLKVIGIRPINNIVDVTNYVLHELGQPLHAFDADEIQGGQIIVRNANEGEVFITLDEVERKLSSEDLVIGDREKPLCLAGVFGGISSGVTAKTKRVFLESAYFNAVSVRKTSKRHGLKTDASFRFERGTDPNITVYALERAALLIQEIAGGAISSEISDIYPTVVEPFIFDVSLDRVRKLIGKDIANEEIKEIIKSLEIAILDEKSAVISVSVPPYKVDVTREVDIIEEVLRIYGYNRIEMKQQIKASLTTVSKPDKELVQHTVSDLLVANAYYEIMSNSLTKMAYTDDESTVVRILNPLSGDLDVMRQNMLFSSLEAIAYNQKRRNANLKFFEFGKTYHLIDGQYVEKESLSLTITGALEEQQWNQQTENITFYDIKSAVDALLKRFNITNYQTDETKGNYLEYGLQYLKGQKPLVNFGKVSSDVLKKVDVSGEVYFADVDWDLWIKTIRKNKITYREVSRFPSVRRDLSLLIGSDVDFGHLKRIAEKTERKLLRSIQVFDVYTGNKLPSGKKSYALSFELQDEQKTLTDKQIDSVMQKLILNFEKEVGAEVRKA
ncbi:phenylalanine--tRNA ligase subunit beta [Olivibacter sp. SDN3]|uniref:phenylalanine--tRNA ligase subunit beta n=1 Tax=Olivibacter sp. SDN3 TaxID=2764720 RepID=UPI00165187E4|nr:phenylalanine--tRNA ligase subunit beta [Olivibacter sp. SDN3]QNL49476.1 phenylalanine--tRNA ligase subunit beta [Olivibacter sp. SDN3]